MGFVIHKVGDLVDNARMISFYKKELYASHIVDKAKKLKHYGTKEYRKRVFDFPSKRRYQRMKAIVSYNYRHKRKIYSQMADLGKRI